MPYTFTSTRKNIAATALGSILVCSASLCHAEDSSGNYADYNPFVSVQLGYGGMDTGKADGDGSSSVDSELEGFAYRLGIGYLFEVIEGLSIGPEIGYEDYADNDYRSDGASTGSVEGYNIDLLANLRYRWSDWYVLGKVGGAYATQRTATTALSRHGASVRTERKVLPKLGVGIGYIIIPNVSIDLTYNHIFGETDNANADNYDDFVSVSSTNTFLFGFNFSF